MVERLELGAPYFIAPIGKDLGANRADSRTKYRSISSNEDSYAMRSRSRLYSQQNCSMKKECLGLHITRYDLFL